MGDGSNYLFMIIKIIFLLLFSLLIAIESGHLFIYYTQIWGAMC